MTDTVLWRQIPMVYNFHKVEVLSLLNKRKTDATWYNKRMERTLKAWAVRICFQSINQSHLLKIWFWSHIAKRTRLQTLNCGNWHTQQVGYHWR